jgi:hypothetical protein
MQCKILSRGLVAVIGCFAFGSAANDALAQQSSMFGSGGSTGGSSGIGAASGVGAFQTPAFPSSAFPTPGASATGTGGFGGQQGQGFGGQPGMGANGQQTGLLGTSTGPLIGTGAPAGMNQPGQNGQMPNRQGQQNRNNANRRPGQNRNQQNQAGGMGAANQQKTTVRPQLVVAFDHPHPDAETMQAAITTRFGKLASNAQFKGIEVEAAGNMVILRGQVDSPRTMRLATILARMEPGVKKVQNELTVKEPLPPSPSPVD